MIKYIICLLLIVSCGARKSAALKTTDETDFSSGQNLSTNTENSTESQSTLNLSTLAQNQKFSIKGGQPYTLNYNGIIYSGSSAIEISNNKVETKVNLKTISKTYTKTFTKYQTKTNYRHIDTYKNKVTDKKAYPVWSIILISIAVGFFLKILVGFALSKIKVSNPYLSLLNKLK